MRWMKAINPKGVFPLWLTYLLVAAGPSVLVGRELVAGKVLYWGTPSLQFVPWWVEGMRQLLAGNLPLWNSLNGMGAPLLANYQSAFFYPPNWSLFFFGRANGAGGIAWGFTFLAMLHLIWGGWGMVALLRNLGASPLAQVIGGSAFALSGYLVGRLEFISMIWVAAWTPWVLRYVNDLASLTMVDRSPNKVNWLHFPLIFCLAMQLLAGHAQLTWYTLELAGAWLVVGALRRHNGAMLLGAIARFGLACFVGAAIASIQLLPTAEYLLNSQRAGQVAYTEALTYSFWPWRLLTLFAPDFFGNPGTGNFWGYASFWEDHAYIGLLPLLMALSTLPQTVRRSALSARWLDRFSLRFFWITALVSLVFALGSNTPVFPFFYFYIPSFDMFQAPARYLLWLVIAFIILAAFGIDNWRYPSGKGLYWLRLGVAGAFAVTAGAGLGWILLTEVKLTFISATATAGFWALGTGILALLLQFTNKPFWAKIWPGAVYLWVIADLLLAGWHLNPTLPESFYNTPIQSHHSLRNTLAGKRIYLASDFEYFIKFFRFFRFQDYRRVEDGLSLRKALMPNLNLLEGISSINNFDPFIPERYSTWMNILDHATTNRRLGMLARMNAGAEQIFAGNTPNGYAWSAVQDGYETKWYPCALPVASGQEALYRLSQNEFRADRLVIEGVESSGPGCDEFETGSAEILKIDSKSPRYTTQADRAGWLFISQVWYPGWVARIDGEITEPYRADFLFMAIAVPAGEHEISLHYQPRVFLFGAMLSILMLIGLPIICYIQHYRHSRIRKVVTFQ